MVYCVHYIYVNCALPTCYKIAKLRLAIFAKLPTVIHCVHLAYLYLHPPKSVALRLHITPYCVELCTALLLRYCKTANCELRIPNCETANFRTAKLRYSELRNCEIPNCETAKFRSYLRQVRCCDCGPLVLYRTSYPTSTSLTSDAPKGTQSRPRKFALRQPRPLVRLVHVWPLLPFRGDAPLSPLSPAPSCAVLLVRRWRLGAGWHLKGGSALSTGS